MESGAYRRKKRGLLYGKWRNSSPIPFQVLFPLMSPIPPHEHSKTESVFIYQLEGGEEARYAVEGAALSIYKARWSANSRWACHERHDEKVEDPVVTHNKR